MRGVRPLEQAPTRLRDSTHDSHVRGVSVPSLEAPEIYGRTAIVRIARALPLVERIYASIRFAILRPKLLSVMDLLLPAQGRILDVGCGFGLFAAYFGQTQPARAIVGVDPDERRVRMATKVSETLGLNNRFIAGDIRNVTLDGEFDGAYVLDVMHHLPADDQWATLAQLRESLKPGGTLVIKDITTEPRFGLEFTRLLDRAMIGMEAPLHYRHHRAWGDMLVSLGFDVRMVRVPDVLPYPHVVIAATRR